MFHLSHPNQSFDSFDHVASSRFGASSRFKGIALDCAAANARAGTSELIMSTMKILSALLLLASLAPADGYKSKIRRVRAGKLYTEHDDVHIVVNKVG